MLIGVEIMYRYTSFEDYKPDKNKQQKKNRRILVCGIQNYLVCFANYTVSFSAAVALSLCLLHLLLLLSTTDIFSVFVPLIPAVKWILFHVVL